jgi:lysozyme
MITSDEGLALIKSHEGLRLKAYQDIVGVWTIGYGHTGSDVTSGLVWDQDTCDSALRKDLTRFENCVGFLVTIPLNQNQFDALVSFCYNLGCVSLKTSTLLKLLNAGDYAGAEDEFVKWDRAGGVVVQGLLNRRQDEQKLFMKEC